MSLAMYSHCRGGVIGERGEAVEAIDANLFTLSHHGVFVNTDYLLKSNNIAEFVILFYRGHLSSFIDFPMVNSIVSLA
jgi:hypothetical protein